MKVAKELIVRFGVYFANVLKLEYMKTRHKESFKDNN